MDNEMTVVTVNFEKYQGGYLATSKDIKGMFITHRNLAKVYAAVPTAIKMFFKATFGGDFDVSEANPRLTENPSPIGEIEFIARAA